MVGKLKLNLLWFELGASLAVRVSFGTELEFPLLHRMSLPDMSHTARCPPLLRWLLRARALEPIPDGAE